MPFGKFEKFSSFIYLFICVFSTPSSFSYPSRMQSELFCYNPTVPNVLSGFVFRSIFSPLFSLGDFYWSTFSSLILSSVSSVFLSQSIKVFYFRSFFQQSHLPGWSAGLLGVVSLGTDWSPRDLSSCSRSQGPACLVRCWEGRPDTGQATLAPEPSGVQRGLETHKREGSGRPFCFPALGHQRWPQLPTWAADTLGCLWSPPSPAPPSSASQDADRPWASAGCGCQALAACSARFFSMSSPFSMQDPPVMMVAHTVAVTAPARPADVVPGVLGEPACVPPGRVRGHFPLLWMRKHTHRLCGGLTRAHVLARAQDRTGRV